MAETRLPQRIDYPNSSMATGELFVYLTRMALAVNQIPTFSFYSGNPNSSLTGNIGALVVNIATSLDTARLWQKRMGSSNTGWVSVATV